MAEKKRVLIADDHAVVVEGIRNILNGEQGFEIVGTAADGLKTIEMVKSLKPDLLILDVSMPKLDGIEAAYEIKKTNPKIRILVYSMTATREHVVSLFKAGVSGYVLKEEPLSELLLALKTLTEGAAFYSSAVREILRDHIEQLELGTKGVQDVRNGIAKLSAREKEVFVLLADGLPIKEIAQRLYISTKTVESHKYNIMEKLNVPNLAGLTKLALRKELIKL